MFQLLKQCALRQWVGCVPEATTIQYSNVFGCPGKRLSQNKNILSQITSIQPFSKQSKKIEMITIEGMAWGEYGLHASSQKLVCDELYNKYTRSALDHILHQGKTTITLADFGAADCVNTVDIYTKLLEQVRAEQGKDVIFYINDLPSNDWEMATNSCAPIGIPIVQEKDEARLRGDKDGSRFEFVGKSFYSQCLPSQSVDIAFCSIANHWLSSGEGIRLAGSILHSVHEERTSLECRDAMKNRSMEDGVNFLVSRAQELQPGGFLFMGNLSNIEKEDGEMEGTMRALVETINDILIKWVEGGKLSQDQVDQITFPCYFKTEEEWRQCFEDPRVKETGLKMMGAKNAFLENPYYGRIYRSQGGEKNVDTARLFAAEYMKSFLAISRRMLTSVFENEHKLNEFIEDVVVAITTQPHNYKVDYCITYIAAKKL